MSFVFYIMRYRKHNVAEEEPFAGSLTSRNDVIQHKNQGWGIQRGTVNSVFSLFLVSLTRTHLHSRIVRKYDHVHDS